MLGKTLKKLLPYVVLLLLSVFVLVFIWLISLRDPTTFESLLFQLIVLVIGLLGSYIFGKNSARAGALEVVRPHARSAFRRVRALYLSLYLLSERIEEMKEEKPDYRLDIIQALVHEHIRTGQDALEDWRDIIPVEIKEIEGRSTKQ